jgi:glycosyltransferase involved in cell wall biosynthesis
MLENKAALNVLTKVCDWVYRGADRLTVLSPGFKRKLIERGVAPEKIEVVYNWCDEASIQVDASLGKGIKPPEFSGKFVILFAGTMGLAQGLDTVLDCAMLLRETLPAVQFVLIGGGVDRPRLEKRAEDLGLKNVTFLPFRSPDTMDEIFAMSDALLVHLKDDQLYRITIPSKTQAYLYAGKPIIMAMRGDAADLVRKSGAGVICEPEDTGAMFKAIKVLYEMHAVERQKMGEAGRSFYQTYLSFDVGVHTFESLFKLCL